VGAYSSCEKGIFTAERGPLKGDVGAGVDGIPNSKL
jgi:hypothetical protein